MRLSRLGVLEPLVQISLEISSNLLDGLGVGLKRCMQVLAVSAVSAHSQLIGLVRGDGVVYRGSLPGVVREVRVEHLVGGGLASTISLVHLHGGWEHRLAEDLGALLQVVVQVDRLGSQTSGVGSRVEVGHLVAGLPSPGARVHIPSGRVSEGFRVICRMHTTTVRHTPQP